MADRHSVVSKDFPQNHKKKKNKGAKKKDSNSKTLTRNHNNLVSVSRKMKSDNVLSKDRLDTGDDNYYKSSSKTRDFCSPKHEYHNSRDRTEKYSSPSDHGKYMKIDSPSSGTKKISPRKFRDGYEDSYAREHDNDRKTYNEMEYRDNTYTQNCRSSQSIDSVLERLDYLTSEIKGLNEETNNRLRDSISDIQYNWVIHSNSDVNVIFKKRELNEKFSHVLQHLISQLLSGKISIEEVNNFCSSKSSEEDRKTPEPDCLFAVDCSAESYDNENASIPIYDASFNQILESPTEANSSPKNTASEGRYIKCFNCDGNHNMRNCPNKMDYRRIAIARKKTRPSYSSPMRYHVQGKNESGFKPGVISDDLREALGLQRNQLPLYVYHMRIIDYPPGWLSEAAVESSGITVYGTDGNVEKEKNCEDGEVDTSSVRVQYDPDKLIDYPGFNVPLSPDAIDESFELGLPPIQNHQLRCVIEKNMAKPDVRPSRKRKGSWNNNRPSKIDRVEEDMDIEDTGDVTNEDSGDFVSDFIPPLPETAPPPLPPPPPPADSTDVSEDMILSKSPDFQDDNSASAIDSFKIKSCSDFSSGTSSPSLAELEEIKKKLVMELGIGLDDDPSSNASQEGDSIVNVEPNEEKVSDEPYILEDEFVASDISIELSNISDSSSTINKSCDSPEPLDSMQRTLSKSKCMMLGSPSLSHHSSYSKLPAYEQFSKNVSSHIPFENLPDSTGKYEKLKTVLKKVKDKINSLMK